MATLKKQSVREEFDKLKASFDEQVKAGKVSSGVASLFNALVMLFSIVLSIFMEKKTKKTSSNSSIPSSQTNKDETADKKKGTNGNGLKETTTTIGNTRTVEETIVLPVTNCHTCGEDLSELEVSSIERRTRIDIMFEKVVEHFDSQSKKCPGLPHEKRYRNQLDIC